MRAKVLVPLLLVIAAAAGLMFGARSSTSQTTVVAAEQDGGQGTGGSASPTVVEPAKVEEQPGFDAKKLAPGEQPPQFVVVSFDGACEMPSGIMQHFIDTAKQVDGRFSFFLSGLCLLPENDQKYNYKPPHKNPGDSAIGFGTPEYIPARLDTLAEAYRDGNEIGTHYLGHFCDANGVAIWNTADWTSEITQFNEFLDNWPKYNPGLQHDPLPFDSSVIKGGRTPCLAGKRAQMRAAFEQAGYKYDASDAGSLEWPQFMPKYGMWNFPLQTIKVAGYGQSNLSMDYNFLVTQNDGKTDAEPAKCQKIEDSTYQSYMDAAEAVYNGNRAPLFIGNHLNEWACGAYKKALTRFIVDFHAKHPDAQFISNQDLVQWLDAQDPQVIKELQAKGVQNY